MRRPEKLIYWIAAIVFIVRANNLSAGEFEKKGKALSSLLGTTKVKVKKVPRGKQQVEVYFTKEGNALGGKIAVIEEGLYPPNCTHTWAIGIDTKSGKVNAIRVLEMQCPHAFPCQKASYLEQYIGKGPADVATLDKDIQTIAKATATANLTTDAVKRAIQTVNQIKGTL